MQDLEEEKKKKFFGRSRSKKMSNSTHVSEITIDSSVTSIEIGEKGHDSDGKRERWTERRHKWER